MFVRVFFLLLWILANAFGGTEMQVTKFSTSTLILSSKKSVCLNSKIIRHLNCTFYRKPKAICDRNRYCRTKILIKKKLKVSFSLNCFPNFQPQASSITTTTLCSWKAPTCWSCWSPKWSLKNKATNWELLSLLVKWAIWLCLPLLWKPISFFYAFWWTVCLI